MYIISEKPDTGIKLRVETLIEYEQHWEQVKDQYKRTQEINYTESKLLRLLRTRSSRWYTSYYLKTEKNYT